MSTDFGGKPRARTHFWRAFFIALALYLGAPLALVLLCLVIPALAMLYAFVIYPVIVYAYPVMILQPHSDATALLTVLAAFALCAVFAFCMRRREDSGDVWLLALLSFAGWWLVCRLAFLLAGLSPVLDVRM